MADYRKYLQRYALAYMEKLEAEAAREDGVGKYTHPQTDWLKAIEWTAQHELEASIGNHLLYVDGRRIKNITEFSKLSEEQKDKKLAEWVGFIIDNDQRRGDYRGMITIDYYKATGQLIKQLPTQPQEQQEAHPDHNLLENLKRLALKARQNIADKVKHR